MPTTANGLPYPALTDTPDVPYWLQQLADALEARGKGKATKSGIYTAATPRTAGVSVVTHGAGFTPTAVLITPKSTGLQFRVDNFTATTFDVQVLNSDGTANNGTAFTFSALVCA